MKDFFQPDIFSYLILGPVMDNYLRLKERLALLKVKPHQIIDLADWDRQTISIEEIRVLRRKVRIKPTQAGEKLYLFLRGRQLGIPAQNALLKLAEEPPEYLRIIILCQDKSDILPTLSSRCAIIRQSFLTDQRMLTDPYPDFSPMNLKDLFRLSERLAPREDLGNIVDSWLLTNYSRGVMTKIRQEECQKLLDAKKLLVQTNVNRRLLLDNLLMELKNDRGF